VIIEPAEEEDKTKVGGDICAVLFPDHIKKYKQQGIWPFEDRITKEASSDEEEEESGSDDDLFVNNNRPTIEESESESDSEEESEEEK
jgi:probable RNA-binding protein EIF1AD